jgi:hypothetical protein
MKRYYLPGLAKIPYNLNENFVITYYDSSKRLIVIAKINEGETSQLFRILKKNQYMDTLQPYWSF